MSQELDTNMKILIIDDMGTMRKIVRNMLIQLGYNNVCEADDGASGLPVILKSHEDNDPIKLVISDWNMPELSGIELLKKLRAHDHFKELPFLLITAEAEQGNVMLAVKEGVSNFIVKPFSAQVLKEKIYKIFNK